MTRTQVQLPNRLYEDAKRVADLREISLAELVRRGLEYMIAISSRSPAEEKWALPAARRLGGGDPFADPDWRMRLHVGHAKVAETPGRYAVKPRRSGKA